MTEIPILPFFKLNNKIVPPWSADPRTGFFQVVRGADHVSMSKLNSIADARAKPLREVIGGLPDEPMDEQMDEQIDDRRETRDDRRRR
eukprot:Selendium_serpulae@DN925_c0_g1_i1.p1